MRDQYIPVRVRPTVTNVLIAVNILIWIFTTFYGLISGTDANLKFGAKFNPLIMSGEYWRLVTPIFLHGGILHLLMNSYSLYAVGPVVERLFGSAKFIVIYLSAGIMGNIASFLVSTNPSVGASGAIFGLVGALGCIALKNRETFGRALGTNLIIIIGYNLVYGFTNSRIDNSAHIGGLVGGFIMAAALGMAGEWISAGKRVAISGLAMLLAAGGIYGGFVKPENVEFKKEYEATNFLSRSIQSFNEKDYAKSEEFARRAIEAHADDKNINADAYYLLTASMINQGKGAEAVPYAQTLVQLRPRSGHYLLGLCYLQADKPELARAELEKAYELDPGNSHAKELLDALQKQLQSP